jgi:hypothetical protein
MNNTNRARDLKVEEYHPAPLKVDLEIHDERLPTPSSTMSLGCIEKNDAPTKKEELPYEVRKEIGKLKEKETKEFVKALGKNELISQLIKQETL